MQEKQIESPFEVSILEGACVIVTNDNTKLSCYLTPQALAVYHVIKSAKRVGDYRIIEKGLIWFEENYPAEYLTLFD